MNKLLCYEIWLSKFWKYISFFLFFQFWPFPIENVIKNYKISDDILLWRELTLWFIKSDKTYRSYYLKNAYLLDMLSYQVNLKLNIFKKPSWTAIANGWSATVVWLLSFLFDFANKHFEFIKIIYCCCLYYHPYALAVYNRPYLKRL